MDSEERLAVFIDYENLALGARDHLGIPFDFGPIADALAVRGRVVLRRAYADWSYFDEDRRALTRHQVELIEMTQRMGASRKNAADIKMVVDAIEMAFEREYISTFVICTGDSDFSPLVHKLRELNRQVIGVGVELSTSRLLPPACDEFLFYDRLEGVDVPDDHEPPRPKKRGRGGRPVGKAAPKSVSSSGTADAPAEAAPDAAPAATESDADGAEAAASAESSTGAKAGARGGRRRSTASEGADAGADTGAGARSSSRRPGRGSKAAPDVQDTDEPDDAVDEPLDVDETDDAVEPPSMEVRVAQTLSDLEASSSGPVVASALKRALLRKDPTFSESAYGFRSFGEFVRYLAERGVVELGEGPSTGDPTVSLPAQGDTAVAFALLRDVVAQDGGSAALSGLKDHLRKVNPAFSEKALGFRGFLQFCRAAQEAGVVTLRWDDDEDGYLVTT
ncbi:NYN domain-containing protein [Luteimicrobium subarcticum]|uniref:Uncharacterized LabA/DUF88 family protein n=1 Tax=Luteimicrobium subarcticum TaxID=620910 RepID=A0A2M8WV49_9MICO|nr:NYN domain-containing protein [Luteimicrobium subarcticum]PJI94805.1 uncharacterized LabA/DUF88 family protein [Luteimicrobium subarcticum]